ncbi:hypothetical protein [Pedobacter sp. ASV28]|uniref:hypothetical protein n=1 Tax=Pedobacter sp. ASV28 TaxID=2795123 RepID=UPI0018EB5FF4|nr:hypothetical protein [Pedobacter sp. ASV28]
MINPQSLSLLNTKYNCLGSYSDFLSAFLKRGYTFKKFREPQDKNGQIVLRHDIDFDISFAYKAALVEKQLGIQSTFFFLLRSEFYNPFSKPNFDLIKAIQHMGHDISIHFDPSIYDDFKEGFIEEITYFKHVFNTEIDIISIHRPNDFFQNHDEPIANIPHTYQKKYFKDIKYFADSTGAWRFGNPIESEEFSNLHSIHLLTHPIWWFVEGNNNLEILTEHFSQKKTSLKQYFYDNSIPFRKISDHV